jgi:exonuclease SbcC
VGGKEFIILDEPFAFFDAKRTQKTLEVLPRMSNEIEQTWILAQSFEDESQLDLHFRCSRDSEELIAAG